MQTKTELSWKHTNDNDAEHGNTNIRPISSQSWKLQSYTHPPKALTESWCLFSIQINIKKHKYKHYKHYGVTVTSQNASLAK